MPTVLLEAGFRFFFYSRENHEPPHVHIEHGDKLAKYWLDPVELAHSKRFRAHELNELRGLVIQNGGRFLEAWNEHFGA
jgi:hypothetical protein